MAEDDIPAPVLRFIDACIDTVPQLETLLMMREQPGRAWSADEVAARVYIPVAEAAGVLEALRRRGLVAVAAAGTACKISLPDEARRRLIDEVARAYRSNLIRVATLIHEKPPASLKEFARAFDLKKDR